MKLHQNLLKHQQKQILGNDAHVESHKGDHRLSSPELKSDQTGSDSKWRAQCHTSRAKAEYQLQKIWNQPKERVLQPNNSSQTLGGRHSTMITDSLEGTNRKGGNDIDGPNQGNYGEVIHQDVKVQNR